ncbi:MAG: PqqD family protein [Gemmatimonadales bacterium]
MTARYIKHKDLRLTELEGEGVVLHLGTRRYFSVSETGLVILQALDNPQSFDDLVARLLDEYEVTESEAVESTREFLDRCLKAKLVLIEQ